MIATDLKYLKHQAHMTTLLQKAIDFLRRRDLHTLPDGRTEIDGDRVFAMVQRYETVMIAAPKFEAHRKYIDVQYLMSGEEIIGWAPMERISITDVYDAEKDLCFGTVAQAPVRLKAGQAAVLWPEDGHAPKLDGQAPSSVMKIVVKVAV